MSLVLGLLFSQAMPISYVLIAMLTVFSSPSAFAANDCALITPQTASQGIGDVSAYTPTAQICRDAAGATWIATRIFKAKGDQYAMLVDPINFETSLAKTSCLGCRALVNGEAEQIPFLAAVRKLNSAPYLLQNDGMTHSERNVRGSFVTADLCPSRKPLETALFEQLRTQGPKTPIALAITGLWMRNHQSELQDIKRREAKGEIAVTWVNHSFNHPYTPGVGFSENFLLKPGTDMNAEVLETEKMMIANGLTPSVFFRFPGLVSNAQTIRVLEKMSLIPLGADAWIAKGEKPRDGSIILLHANGNEPGGITGFISLMKNGRIPLPLLHLDDTLAPHAH